jgi:hypothetical protein
MKIGQPGWHGLRKRIGGRDACLLIFMPVCGWLLSLLLFYGSAQGGRPDPYFRVKCEVRPSPVMLLNIKKESKCILKRQ